MKEIILATSNAGKIAELSALLFPVNCISQASLNISSAEETGLSFVENALIKARHASRIANRPALADDSGLVVPALNGAPGIYSSRYASAEATDEENIDFLLTNLKNIPEHQRQAYFYCAIALVDYADDPTPLLATGKLEGKIVSKPVGNQGFGYDPIFYVESQQCTAAELPALIKNQISHRAIALNQLQKLLKDML